MHLVYVRGEAYWGLSGGRLQSVLRDRAGLEPVDAEALCQIAERMVRLGRGGTLLITDPGVEVSPAILDLSYHFNTPSMLLKNSVEAMRSDGHRDRGSRYRAALDFVASLTRVDGVVNVTSDLTIQGFGGKIRLKELQDTELLQEEASPTFEAKDRTAQPASLSMSAIPGMRHRSAAQFCMQHEGQALAIVVSQDGDVSLFGRQPDGSVMRIGPFALGVGLGVF
jgi:hypothetical protein